MKAYVDVPRYYWRKDDALHPEFRIFYDNLISGLLENGCTLEASAFRAANDLTAGPDDGIRYSYHSKAPGHNTYCVKGGALPGLWYIDPDGYSGWSRIANDPALREEGLGFDLTRAEQAISRYRERFFAENFSKYAQSDGSLGDAISVLEPFVFYPLQVNSDEVMKLTRFTQVEVIRRLAEFANDTGISVVIKRHPKCDSEHIVHEMERAATHSKHVFLSDASIHQLIARSRAVIVANSGVGQEALIHGKPVYSFGESEYAHITTPMQTLDDIGLVFGPQPMEQPETLKRQLGYLLCEYFVDGHDASSVAARVKRNIADYEQGKGAPAEAAELADRVAMLRSIDKLLYDSTDYMMAIYGQLPVEAQERTSTLLVRATRNQAQRDQILRHGDEKTLIKCALQYFRENDLAQAELFAHRAQERFGSSAALYALAKVILKKGEKDRGMDLAERAASAENPSPEAMVFIGHKLLGAKPAQPDAALVNARKAQTIQPGYARAYWLEARALLEMTGPEAALVAANRAVDLSPTNIEFVAFRDKVSDALRSEPNLSSPETPG